MAVVTGLDRLLSGEFALLDGKKVGLVCNQATVASNLRHIYDLFLAGRESAGFRLAAVFGPQHGLFGHTQDNMIEWEGAVDPRSGIPIYSLYGEHREPTDAMLAGIDTLVVDLPDIGARYYTFIWTTANCLKAAERLGIEVIVLDRPNPLGGVEVEGSVQEPGFESFVGLYPLPMRHGMTLGEIARYLQSVYFPRVRLSVVEAEGWSRESYFEGTGLPWVMPSPNMPTVDTALVYPGMCLLEGTNLSEGRGTTKPFEIFGAPWLDAHALCDELNVSGLEGVYFRPTEFQPTFQKHAGQLCGGATIHVLDRRTFRPALSAVSILLAARKLAPNDFAWNPPPYEYETIKLPIDILAGNTWIREGVDSGERLNILRDRMDEQTTAFAPLRQSAIHS